MFVLDDFQEYPDLQNIIIKINKFLIKNKIDKVSKLIEELEYLLENSELTVP